MIDCLSFRGYPQVKSFRVLAGLTIMLWLVLAPLSSYAATPEARQQAKQEARQVKEETRIRSTWNEKKRTDAIVRLQSQALKEDGACTSDCIAQSECLINSLMSSMPYDNYVTSFLTPLRLEDMSQRERAVYDQDQSAYAGIVQSCKARIAEDADKTGTIAGLEWQIQQLDQFSDPAKANPWLEFHRGEDSISQYDQSSVEATFGPNREIYKTVWIRQFLTKLRGNYSKSQHRYDCTQKEVTILRYVVNTPFDQEVFGDYMISQPIPLALSNKDAKTKKKETLSDAQSSQNQSEDQAIYLRLCPAEPDPKAVPGLLNPNVP